MANRHARALNSIGATLTDTLDDLITDTRIDPQLAMKILANFDRAIADVLQEKVKARLTFKVGMICREASEPSACPQDVKGRGDMRSGSGITRLTWGYLTIYRARSTPTDSATRSGLS